MKFDDWFSKDQRINTLSFNFTMYVLGVLAHTKWGYVTPLNVGNDELNIPHHFSVSDRLVKEKDATYVVAIFHNPLTILVHTRDIARLKEMISEEEIIKDRGEFVETFEKLFGNICTIKWKTNDGWDLDMIAVVDDPDTLFEDTKESMESLKGDNHPIKIPTGGNE